MAELKDANTNPWYVLMTLYGEQTGSAFDWDLHQKNMRAWNVWSCAKMLEDQRARLSKELGVRMPSPHDWGTLADQITKQHHDVMVERNSKDFDYPGFPMATDKIQLSKLKFNNPLQINRFIFGQFVFARSCIFKEEVTATEAIFLDGFDVTSSIFENSTLFDECQFFRYATFQGANFNANVYFDESKFRCEVVFNRINAAGSIDFVEVEFLQDISFNSAQFNGDISMVFSKFHGRAEFKQAMFFKSVDFTMATFDQYAVFSETYFCEGAAFSGVRFDGHVKFDKSEFCSSGLAGSQSSCVANFDDCIFSKPASFRGAFFSANYPNFNGALLNENTAFSADSNNWPEDVLHNKSAARDSCAKIRHSLAKQGLPEDEHFFFRREMRFAAQIGSWFDRLPYRLFGLLSDYGHSIARPVTGLGLLWIVPALIYTFAFEWMLIMDSKRVIALDGFGLSFANIFKFFGFQRTYYDIDEIQGLHYLLQLMGAAQTVVGFILLFFLGLGLRTRFRMR